MSDLAVIAAVGGAQLASTALTVLTDIALGVGAIGMLCIFLLAVVLLWPARRPPGHAATQPSRVIEVGDDAIAMLTYCPWCDPVPVQEVVSAGECTCSVPCEGVSYCLAAVSRG